MTMEVEIWSDIVCPWCYLGKRRFERALDSFSHRDDVEVVYRSFELDPSAPRDTTDPMVDVLASKYGMTAQQAQAAQRQMEDRARQDGLTFRMDGLRRGSTRDAHRLLHLARASGRQQELMERLHQAYFTDQDSIFDHDALTRLAVDAGLDAAEVADVLNSDRYDDDVTADEMTAQALGATGVPFFVIDRKYGISGAQPAEAITAALDQAWASARA